jgi:lipoprotein-releasing system permease protein
MWPLFLARKQLFPPGKFPVFAFVSTLGVALGVAALLIVQTVMFSFGEEHRKRIRESLGDVFVKVAGDRPFSGAEALRANLVAQPGVEAAAAGLRGGAVLQLEDGGIRFQLIHGIDPLEEPKVTPLARLLSDPAALASFDDERAILGKTLAQKHLLTSLGERVTIYTTPEKLKKLVEGKGVMVPRELEVCGLLDTGFGPVDENMMFVTLAAARELFELPRDAAHFIHLKLRDHRQAAAFAAHLNDNLLRSTPFYAEPWTASQRAFLESVEMEKQMLFFLMFIILLVASFSIGSTLFNHVIRRTREIGLVGALGGSPASILALFLYQGLLVGVAGYGIGVGLTFFILHFRQEILVLMGAEKNLLQQYMFEKVPLFYNPADFGKAAVLTLVLMLAVSLLPALWAARRKPSEAMRDAA